MTVISFSVSDEQAAEAQAYALAKGYGRASNLARVAMIQMMSRYPKTGRHATDAPEGAHGAESQRGVHPSEPAGQETGGAA